MKWKMIVVLFVAVVSSGPLYSGDVVSKVGTTAAPFLEFSVGSRATAMGGAYTAVANDATALYWNPAGISSIPTGEVTFNYLKWLAGMTFTFTGGVLNAGSFGAFGLSITSLATPDMVVRTVDEPEGLGTRFDAGDLAIGLTYARQLTDRFSFGSTFKFIQRRIWHMSANGIAMDFGVLYTMPWDRVKMGMSILNFGSKLQIRGVDALVFTDIDPSKAGNNTAVLAHLRTKTWSLPILFKFGLAYTVLNNHYNHIIVSGDFLHPNNNYESANIGMEYAFLNRFFLRLGYNSLFLKESENGLTFGLGVLYQRINMGYSYARMKHFNFVQQFSIGIQF